MRNKSLLTLLLIAAASNLLLATVNPGQQRLTLDFKEADIRDILRAVGTQFKVNLVMDPNVAGNITIHLENVPLMDGLRTMLESNGFSMEQKGEILYVKKLDPGKYMNIRIESDRMWLDVRGRDIQEVIREISNQGKINIVADQSVRGDISGLLHNIPVETGLTSLLSANGYLLRRRAGIYEVTKAGGDPGRRKSMAVTVDRQEAGDSAAVPRLLATIDVNDADLGNLMQEISAQAGFNIVTYGDIRGSVNAKIEKMPLEDALKLVFQGTNYTYKRVEPIYGLGKPIFLVGDKNPSSVAAQALTKTELLRLNHIKADGIPALLPSSIGQTNIKVIKEQNALLMTGTEDQIQQLREFLGQIDIVSPQIMIECLVVELSKRSSLELGFKGGYFKPDTTQMAFPRFTQHYSSTQLDDVLDEIAGRLRMGSLGKLPTDFILAIDALEVAGKAKVRARPRITTLNGNQANINVGWVRYYQTSSQTPQGTITQLHSIDAGITLEIVPWVAASGEITTEIRPTVSNLSGIGAGGLPEISRRTVNTTIRLRDGETIVIGGLIQRSSANSREKLPVLGDIPFLGVLFSKTSSTSDESELVIYITPHIISGE